MASEQPTPITPVDPPRPRARTQRADETVKETFESIIIAFILAFVFRAYVVEAFVIPTGSMAPTLLGAHLRVKCDQCGYEFETDWPKASTAGDNVTRMPVELQQVVAPACPMCRYRNFAEAGTRPYSGDRILVQKYIYAVSEPQRWDVVVFKNPTLPDENYIKRLVGLPGEALHIFEGNIYVQPLDAAGEPAGPWQIARKTVRPEVQTAVWQPIYHSQYIPLDGGQSAVNPQRTVPWSVPWVADQPDDWLIENRRSYTYTGESTGQIRFNFDAQGRRNLWPNIYPYNQFHGEGEFEPIEDIRLALVVEPQRPGLSVALSTTARMDALASDAAQNVLRAIIDADGQLRLEVLNQSGQVSRELASVQLDPLPARRNTAIELWYVDQEASVWVEGEPVLRVPFDLSMEQLLARPQAQFLPDVSVTVSGGPATLHRVQLDRDIYYSSTNPNGMQARGGLERTPRPALPVLIGPDEFFCMGDNSPLSHDSRFWDQVDPWVRQLLFQGQARYGMVPREMMMGRAFFVYFPALYHLRPTAPGIFPNFGDMRFIH